MEIGSLVPSTSRFSAPSSLVVDMITNPGEELVTGTNLTLNLQHDPEFISMYYLTSKLSKW